VGPGFLVICALMAKQVMSGKLAGEMKEILHSVGFRPVLGLSGPVAGLT
jgi:hypothetical protein